MSLLKSLLHSPRDALAILAITLASATCQMARAMPANEAATVPGTNTSAGWWNQGKEKIGPILDDGALSIVLSGYAHHGRNTYTPERLKELNEKAWGLGFSKQIRTASDNEESLYALAISDSHFKPQLMAGYLHQWMQPLGHGQEAGLGLTGLFISRADYFSGVPFPIVLPVASIGTRKTKLMGAYIPRLSRNKGNGDVLFLFIRADLD